MELKVIVSAQFHWIAPPKIAASVQCAFEIQDDKIGWQVAQVVKFCSGTATIGNLEPGRLYNIRMKIDEQSGAICREIKEFQFQIESKIQYYLPFVNLIRAV